MAGKKSRRKGVAAEQHIVKVFRNAFGGEWSRKKIGTPGPDIETPKDFPFAIEVKNDASVKMIHLYRPTALLRKYWDQASAQADALDLAPLLVCKIESHWFASTNWDEWRLLEDWIAYSRNSLCIMQG